MVSVLHVLSYIDLPSRMRFSRTHPELNYMLSFSSCLFRDMPANDKGKHKVSLKACIDVCQLTVALCRASQTRWTGFLRQMSSGRA